MYFGRTAALPDTRFVLFRSTSREEVPYSLGGIEPDASPVRSLCGAGAPQLWLLALSSRSRTRDGRDATAKRRGAGLAPAGANDSARGFRRGAALARNPARNALRSAPSNAKSWPTRSPPRCARSSNRPASGTVIGERTELYLRDAISQDSDKGLVEELLRRERALANSNPQPRTEDCRPRCRGVATTAPSLRKRRMSWPRSSRHSLGNPRRPRSLRLQAQRRRQPVFGSAGGSAVLAAGVHGEDGKPH